MQIFVLCTLYYTYFVQANVEGVNCDRCQPGFYDLSKDNELGCRECFCFGISNVCQSAGLGLVQVSANVSRWSGPEKQIRCIFEPRCEKGGLRGFRPGPTQSRLYNHRRWLEA